MKKFLKITLGFIAFCIVAFLLLGLFIETRPDRASAEAAIPDAEPEATAETASEVVRLIPGIMPADLYLSLEQRGFTVEKDFGPSINVWNCEQVYPSVKFTASVYGYDAKTVSRVRADVMADGVNKTAVAGRDFLAFVASMPYDGAQPATARDWVMANFETEGVSDTTIGGVSFRLNSPTVVYTQLNIGPTD